MEDNKNNRKIVLTGGPCCGKTTTINELARRGYQTLDESARLVLEEGIYHPSKNAEEFQKAILRRQHEMEQTTEGITFLDRGAVDGVAYSILFLGRKPDFFKQHNLLGRYDQVFLLDRFPLKADGVRVESSDEDAQKIHDQIHATYWDHGYSPIKVPVMPLEERAEFILANINPGILNAS